MSKTRVVIDCALFIIGAVLGAASYNWRSKRYISDNPDIRIFMDRVHDDASFDEVQAIMQVAQGYVEERLPNPELLTSVAPVYLVPGITPTNQYTSTISISARGQSWSYEGRCFFDDADKIIAVSYKRSTQVSLPDFLPDPHFWVPNWQSK